MILGRWAVVKSDDGGVVGGRSTTQHSKRAKQTTTQNGTTIYSQLPQHVTATIEYNESKGYLRGVLAHQ
jgi:hypothetical protein